MERAEVLLEKLKEQFNEIDNDTLIFYAPWGLYEEIPDHYITARAVEVARCMAGRAPNYPEQPKFTFP